jgi:bifunctional NMN adenylyltransferase/nudix hydrolase
MNENKKADASVFIGRMQPPTKAHKALIEKCFELGHKVIIVIGSATESRSTYVPFTADERRGMVQAMFPGKYIHFILQPDSNYENDEWSDYLKEQVYQVVDSTDHIRLVGCNKDATSFYLKLFPEWEEVEVGVRYNGLSATLVRRSLFTDVELSAWYENVDSAVKDYILNWKNDNADIYDWLYNWEWVVQQAYLIPWSGSPYVPTFNTGDSLVRCNGHVLIITRKDAPGAGQFALPGGFVNARTESMRHCALRELDEEASIGMDVPMSVLHEKIDLQNSPVVFDNPNRDTRGRYITHVYQILLGDMPLPKINAKDDALDVRWIPEKDFKGPGMNGKFYADHLKIIRWFLGISLKESI